MVCGTILESVGFEGNIGSEKSRRRGFGLKGKKGEKKKQKQRNGFRAEDDNERVETQCRVESFYLEKDLFFRLGA